MRTSVAVLIVVIVSSLAAVGRAEQGSGDFDRARERFQQGLVLAQEGFCEPALDHFHESMRLFPTAVAHFNICRCLALLGRNAEAMDAFERYLEERADEIDTARRAEVTAELERLAGLAAQLVIEVAGPASATVLIDGELAGEAPLAEPLRVAPGELTVEVQADGYLPARRRVRADGGSRTELVFSLRPVDQAGTIVVGSALADVEVRLDDEPIGSTPLARAVITDAGAHRIAASRPGYEPLALDVVVDVGETTRVELELRPLDPLPADLAGTLEVEASEPDARLEVDGQAWSGAPVPVGRHRLVARREGFESIDRDVEVVAGETTRLVVDLHPTPEHLERYRARARAIRLAGWATGGVAVTLLGTTLGLYLWNEGRRADHEQRLEDLDPSDPGYSREVADLNDLAGSIDSMEGVEWALLALGCASLGVSLGLLLGGPRPGRYDRVSLVPVPGGAVLRAGF